MPDPLTPDPALMPRIFISHSHEDEAFALKLAADFQRAGAYVWIDKRDIKEGDFLERINDGLAHCDWLVLVETAASLASRPVKMEVNAAQNRVLYLQMRGIIRMIAAPHNLHSVQPTWATLQYYDATVDYGSAVAATLAAIHDGNVRWIARMQTSATPVAAPVPAAAFGAAATIDALPIQPNPSLRDDLAAPLNRRSLGAEGAQVSPAVSVSAATLPIAPTPTNASASFGTPIKPTNPPFNVQPLQSGQLPQARGPRWQALLALLGGTLVVIGYLLPWVPNSIISGDDNMFIIFQNSSSLIFRAVVLLGFTFGFVTAILGLSNFAHGFSSRHLRFCLFLSSVSLACYLLIDGRHVFSLALGLPGGSYLALFGCLLPFAMTFFSYRVLSPPNSLDMATSLLHPSMRLFIAATILSVAGLAIPWLLIFSPTFLLSDLFEFVYFNNAGSFINTFQMLTGNVLGTISLVTPFIALLGASRFIARFTGQSPLTKGQGYRIAVLMMVASTLTVIGVAQFITTTYSIGGYSLGLWLTLIAALGMLGATISAFVALRRAQRLGQLQQ